MPLEELRTYRVRCDLCGLPGPVWREQYHDPTGKLSKVGDGAIEAPDGWQSVIAKPQGERVYEFYCPACWELLTNKEKEGKVQAPW